MRFDPSPATISQNKSPEAEVTEPPTGNNIDLISQRYGNFNKLIPIDGENGEKRTISSLQIAEITGKAYCGVLKVIRKMDIMRVKITMKNIFSLFVCLKKCCTFVVLQLTIKYANGIFYARKETYILKYRQTISVYHRPMAMVGCSKLGYLSAFLFNNK